MRVTVLHFLEKENDAGSGDPVAGQVAAALERAGHNVSLLGIHGNLARLRSGLARRKPELIFNLMETFGDSQLGLVGLARFLDLFGVTYTGNGPGEYYLQEDKALTKKLLAFDNVRYPDFAVFTQDANLETGGSLRMPLFVKPLRMDASIGIDADSLVHNAREMMERVLLIHDKVRDAALVEEFIEGREFCIGILGNGTPQAFPPIEIDFSGMPPGVPRILDANAKWREDSPEYRGSQVVVPDLADGLRARLQKVALDAYRALRVRDYGRVDLRLTEAGEIYVIEVNASCYLEQSGEFATAAGAAGIDYASLVGRIVDLAGKRYARRDNAVRRRRVRTRGPHATAHAP
jgi:D-alanine-D-alanine ligase